MQANCCTELVRPISVLLVDDHPTMLWGLTMLVESSKTKMEVVGVATNCEEALDLARKTTPDVIVLDLHFPLSSGLDILPALISNSISKVLLLTGEQDQKQLDLAIFRGARGILCKDAPAAIVLKAIERLHEGELWLDYQSLARVWSNLANPANPANPANREVDLASKKLATLTAKEKAIVKIIVNGSGEVNKVIAGRLCMAEHTLRNHLSSIFKKIGVKNRLELYIFAVAHKIDT